MLKKTAIGSAILLIVCLLAFATLFPIAASDTVALARQYNETYEQRVDLLTVPSDGVDAVFLTGGQIQQLIVRRSPDADIHLSTDRYNTRIPTVTASSEKDGGLSLFLARSYTGEFFSEMTRENIRRNMVANLSGRFTDRFLLELPEGVAFDPTRENSLTYDSLSIPGDIAQIEPKPVPLPENRPPFDSSASAAFEASFDAVADGSITEDTFWNQVSPRLDSLVRRVSAAVPDSAAYHSAYAYARACVDLRLTQSLRDALEAQYDAHAIEKSHFYALDLQLDDRQAAARADADTLSAALPADVADALRRPIG